MPVRPALTAVSQALRSLSIGARQHLFALAPLFYEFEDFDPDFSGLPGDAAAGASIQHAIAVIHNFFSLNRIAREIAEEISAHSAIDHAIKLLNDIVGPILNHGSEYVQLSIALYGLKIALSTEQHAEEVAENMSISIGNAVLETIYAEAPVIGRVLAHADNTARRLTHQHLELKHLVQSTELNVTEYIVHAQQVCIQRIEIQTLLNQMRENILALARAANRLDTNLDLSTEMNALGTENDPNIIQTAIDTLLKKISVRCTNITLDDSAFFEDDTFSDNIQSQLLATQRFLEDKQRQIMARELSISPRMPELSRLHAIIVRSFKQLITESQTLDIELGRFLAAACGTPEERDARPEAKQHAALISRIGILTTQMDTVTTSEPLLKMPQVVPAAQRTGSEALRTCQQHLMLAAAALKPTRRAAEAASHRKTTTEIKVASLTAAALTGGAILWRYATTTVSPRSLLVPTVIATTALMTAAGLSLTTGGRKPTLNP